MKRKAMLSMVAVGIVALTRPVVAEDANRQNENGDSTIELTAVQKAFVARMQDGKERELEALAIAARELRQAVRALPRSASKDHVVRRQYEQVRSRLAEIRRDERMGKPYLPLFGKAQIGAFGVITEPVMVRQVVGKSEALVEFRGDPVRRPSSGRVGYATGAGLAGSVQSQVGRTSEAEYETIDAKLVGVSADGLADDEEFLPPGLFEINGTVTYPTALGSTKTVLLVEAVDIEWYTNLKFDRDGRVHK